MKALPAVHAAFVGFGEVNTPRELIERKCAAARNTLRELGIDPLWTEPVSDDAQGRDVARAKAELAGMQFDMIVSNPP